MFLETRCNPAAPPVVSILQTTSAEMISNTHSVLDVECSGFAQPGTATTERSSRKETPREVYKSNKLVAEPSPAWMKWVCGSVTEMEASDGRGYI